MTSSPKRLGLGWGLSSPHNISRYRALVLHDDRGPDRRPVPEERHLVVRHVHATVRAGVGVGARSVPGPPGSVVDEVATAGELHGPVGPGVWVPERAAVRPGRNHQIR